MKSTSPQFVAPSPAIEKRVGDIISKMTLEEKILLLGGHPKEGRTWECDRVGIPGFKMADGPMGIHWWCKMSTSYPACIGLAAAFDRELAFKAGAALGRDCRARGVHYLLAPGVNIYRSPLCGRNFEYLGEDPCLSAETVTEIVKGVQSQAVSATVKHFAVNFQEYDRHNVSSDVDERTLREVYLPAFEAAVTRGGAGAVMTAYNLLNGEHCSENQKLIIDILKGEWGFQGVVMSDWISVYDAAGPALNGLDLEMPKADLMTLENLKPLIESGVVTESMIDDKIRRQLRVAACFGWLDNVQEDKSIPHDDPETRKVALEIARASCVLLKNDGILPLDKNTNKKIALIGFHASHLVFGAGGSALNPPSGKISILDGVEAVAPNADITCHMGIDPSRESIAYNSCSYKTPDGETGVKVEYFLNALFEGKPVDTRIEERMGRTYHNCVMAEGAIQDGFSIRYSAKITPEETGEHAFFVRYEEGSAKLMIDGEMVYASDESATSGGKHILINLEKGRDYAVTSEYVKRGHWSKLMVGWDAESSMKRSFNDAIQAAKESDAVVLCVGFTEYSEGEGFDRTFDFSSDQQRLIKEVCSVNRRVVVVLTAGGNVEMESWLSSVSALLHVWYPGQEGGKAIAEILFGDVNPSGKLPATFERRLEDSSSFDNYHVRRVKPVRGKSNQDSRVRITDGVFTGYRHFDRNGIKPQFPFGYGLSYTTFEYRNLALSSSSIKVGASVKMSFDIANMGKTAGGESAQVYVSDVESSHVRPLKELKNFVKVYLQPGEVKTVSCELDERAFRYFDPEKRSWVIEPGEFVVRIGASSEDIRLSQSLMVD